MTILDTYVVVHAGGFYFRVFGYGLTVMRWANHRPLFSERYGYRRFLYIGPFKIGALLP